MATSQPQPVLAATTASSVPPSHGEDWAVANFSKIKRVLSGILGGCLALALMIFLCIFAIALTKAVVFVGLPIEFTPLVVAIIAFSAFVGIETYRRLGSRP